MYTVTATIGASGKADIPEVFAAEAAKMIAAMDWSRVFEKQGERHQALAELEQAENAARKLAEMCANIREARRPRTELSDMRVVSPIGCCECGEWDLHTVTCHYVAQQDAIAHELANQPTGFVIATERLGTHVGDGEPTVYSSRAEARAEADLLQESTPSKYGRLIVRHA